MGTAAGWFTTCDSDGGPWWDPGCYGGGAPSTSGCGALDVACKVQTGAQNLLTQVEWIVVIVLIFVFALALLIGFAPNVGDLGRFIPKFTL
jgi:hypothetical protein